MSEASTTDRQDDGPSRGSLLVVFLTVFIDLLGFGIVLPVLPVYGRHIAREYQLSDLTIGVIVGTLMASFSLMQFLFLPFWGKLSDRYGRRPILMIGLAGSTLFYFMFGLATAWRSLIGLFVARIGAGISGATIATAQAYIADVTPGKERTKGMALIGAAFALGFTIGPVIGAGSILIGGKDALSPALGYAAAALSGVALLLAIFKLPESLKERCETKRSLLDFNAIRLATSTRTIPLLLLTSFVTVFSFANFESTLSLVIDGMLEQIEGDSETRPPLVGALAGAAEALGIKEAERLRLFMVMVTFSYLGFVLTLAQGFLVRRLATRLSEFVLAATGTITSIVAFLLLIITMRAGHYGGFCLAMALEVVGFSMVTPSIQSLISRRTDATHQGQILGLGQSLSSLARILGPVIGISLLQLDSTYPFSLAAALMFAGLGLVIWQSKADDLPVESSAED